MKITFYAGAADAAGVESTSLPEVSLTAEELKAQLGGDNAELAAVLPHCSLLVDGAPVRDATWAIPANARVDILPPFAGG